MEDRRKYQVGTDNDTPQTVRTELINDAANYLAAQWAKHKFPIPFDRVFFAHGKNVQVIVREVKAEHEGKG